MVDIVISGRTVTPLLRFIDRDGKRILQQMWLPVEGPKIQTWIDVTLVDLQAEADK